MTIYINHHNPATHQDLTITLISSGLTSHAEANMIAQWIINQRVKTWKGTHFVHYE